MRIRFVENSAYAKGSILSLWAARAYTGRRRLLVMDADVLFPPCLLRRLVEAPAASALLLDRSFSDTGEEVKLFGVAIGSSPLARRSCPPAGTFVGEGVGFFKCSHAHAAAYLSTARRRDRGERRHQRVRGRAARAPRRGPRGLGGRDRAAVDGDRLRGGPPSRRVRRASPDRAAPGLMTLAEYGDRHGPLQSHRSACV